MQAATGKKKGPDFNRGLLVFGISFKTTNTICQNPSAALSAGAKSG